MPGLLWIARVYPNTTPPDQNLEKNVLRVSTLTGTV